MGTHTLKKIGRSQTDTRGPTEEKPNQERKKRAGLIDS
jgi:hypothetical protein